MQLLTDERGTIMCCDDDRYTVLVSHDALPTRKENQYHRVMRKVLLPPWLRLRACATAENALPGSTAPSPTDKVGHYAALDGIRGLSALYVLLFHTGHWLDVPWLAVNGGLSVDTFFTLSGFVLARAYKDRKDRLSNVDFLLQRLVRLMPVIALSLFISAPYVALRNSMTSGATYASQIAAAVLLGLLNIPYFHAPPQIGGPQVFPLNGPQFSLFFEIVANAFWWSIRHLNPLYSSATLYIVSACLVLTVESEAIRRIISCAGSTTSGRPSSSVSSAIRSKTCSPGGST
ncbi:acyltransferase family protein (plasmid) [Methylobacterium oryzae CBMB20]